MKFIREIPESMVTDEVLNLEQWGFTLVWTRDSVEVWAETGENARTESMNRAASAVMPDKHPEDAENTITSAVATAVSTIVTTYLQEIS